MAAPFMSPLALKQQLPLSERQKSRVQSSRRTAAAILQGQEARLACIAGPCSIHDCEGALDYGRRFKRLSHEVQDAFFLVMRAYPEKSRTNGGWKGLIYDPDLDGSNDIAKGLFLTRRLLLDLIDLEIPCAAEFLDPLAAAYYDDLVTWGFIGARTPSSQIHRQMASACDFPIGFKNSLSGDLDPAIHGILTARKPQSFLGIGETGQIAVQKSAGNPLTHLVLRGSDARPNFDPASVQTAIEKLDEKRLEPRLLIDCSHGNSGKDHTKQRTALESIVRQILDGNDGIAGVMLESFLRAGRQPMDEPNYGVSITDSCIGWEETEELLLSASADLSPTSISFVQK